MQATGVAASVARHLFQLNINSAREKKPRWHHSSQPPHNFLSQSLRQVHGRSHANLMSLAIATQLLCALSKSRVSLYLSLCYLGHCNRFLCQCRNIQFGQAVDDHKARRETASSKLLLVCCLTPAKQFPAIGDARRCIRAQHLSAPTRCVHSPALFLSYRSERRLYAN